MYYLLLYQCTAHWSLLYLRDKDAAYLFDCWFSFILWWGCWYTNKEPFWQEVGVKSLILRWPLRPVGFLFEQMWSPLSTLMGQKYFLAQKFRHIFITTFIIWKLHQNVIIMKISEYMKNSLKIPNKCFFKCYFIYILKANSWITR